MATVKSLKGDDSIKTHGKVTKEDVPFTIKEARSIRVGDIVTSLFDRSAWKNKKVKILGIDKEASKVYGAKLDCLATEGVNAYACYASSQEVIKVLQRNYSGLKIQ